MLDTAVLILRLILGAILVAHAAQKLFGWFGGNGLRRQATLFESLGLKPGIPMVAMAGTMELLAASLLVLGLATPLAALIGTGTMLVAGLTMHLNSGRFWNSAGGGEYPYVLAAAVTTIGIGGSGQFSLDRLLASGWPPLTPWLEPSWIHALAIPILALLSALPFVLLLRRGRH
jgi:putative oxidoreductase